VGTARNHRTVTGSADGDGWVIGLWGRLNGYFLLFESFERFELGTEGNNFSFSIQEEREQAGSVAEFSRIQNLK
jgi:hypothetical protein